MNQLQIVNIVVSVVCVIIMTVLAWVALYRGNKTEVTFTGTPVDQKIFDKHVAENKGEHDRIFAKLGGSERGMEARCQTRMSLAEAEAKESRRILHRDVAEIDRKVAKLEANDETNTTRLVQMDGKIDRLIERMK